MERIILAVDPGTAVSAYVAWDGIRIIAKGRTINSQVKAMLKTRFGAPTCLVVEGINSYGMPVGREVFETCYFVGRLLELAEMLGTPAALVSRQQVKIWHTHSPKARDSNVRAALIDKYGKPGTKRAPGVTYGLTRDIWSAFAIATYI